MRKKLIITAVLASVMVMCFAQKPHKIMFYNMENFFDTIDDPETNDEEFLPDGAKRWNTAKYDKKLRNMERVLFDIAAIDRNYPAVIGVSEIENRSILEDIASTRKLLPARYAICHYDSPDLRGVDVAFLYRPDVFKLEGSADIPVRIASLPNWRTRGIVTMWGTIDDEPFLFMVAHWPSRLGGQAASAFKRNAAAEQMHAIADSVLKVNPATKIVPWATSTTIRPTRASKSIWAPRPRSRSCSRAISTRPSPTCSKPVWERSPTATHGTSSTISSFRRTSLPAPPAN